MTRTLPSPDAQALVAEAEHLRAGFDRLAAQIVAKVRLDREVARHLDTMHRQSAAIDPATPAPNLGHELPAQGSCAD